jgi:hypothetical protein
MNFNDWFNEQEPFSKKSERLKSILNPIQWVVVVSWLKAAYNQGREDEREKHK